MPKRKREPYGFDVSNRPQNLPLQERKKRRRTRAKDLNSQIAWDKNEKRTPAAMSKYRKGYNKAFQVPKARRRLLELGFLEPGTYPENNHHLGVMFSMPNDIPVKFDDEQAGWISRECYECKRPRLTKSMMEEVRAMLSFAYQLVTGKFTTTRFKPQYESVRSQYSLQDEFAPPTQSLKAKYSVEPEGLKTAFTTPFDATKGMPYPEWCVGGELAHDWSINGCRGGQEGGLARVKKSRRHEYIPSQGVVGTYMLGGRPKTPGIKEDREWLVCRGCLCEKGKHVKLPENWMDYLDSDWNPVNPPWCTTCPITMFEVIQALLPEEEKGRLYCKWLPAQNRFAKRCLGFQSMIPLARKWLDIQGANPDRLVFCKNSGRKSCGKWCALLNIKYEHSVAVHGDLWSTWSKFYQTNLRRDPGYENREQPGNLDEKMFALRQLARYFGRGRAQDDPQELSNNQLGRLMMGLLRAQGQGDLVAEVLANP